ncbi:MAG: integrase core domain-containing protein, partial [Ignavibacteria bacterium]|nr:integrase core domain-containing protein [Ignavibacteria bacterium]
IMLKYLFSLFKSRTQLQLEIIFLRKQLEILNRKNKKVKISNNDRLFFLFMKKIFSHWKENLIIIKPETVIKWHRRKLSDYLRNLSKNNAGRPNVSAEQIQLIRRIANENPMWGVARIHGEILKLGYKVSQATVWRYTPKDRNNRSGQRWKTFLKNHASEIISIDFFTIPTVNFKLLHVLVFLSHGRRKIVHYNITHNPSSEWCSQQIKNALYNCEQPKYLLRDRDCRFGNMFKQTVASFGIRDLVTAYRSPWQNGYCERVIGSIKREFLDHLIILSENHLSKLLKEYFLYYNTQRTHLGLNKDSPETREVHVIGKIEKVSVAGGLHNFYYREAA